MDGSCYNCGARNHLSIACPSQQLYNRCPQCFNVCFTADKHKRGCTRLDFRSILLRDIDSVTEWDEFLKMEYKLVDRVVAVSNRGEKAITSSPLYFTGDGIQIKNIDGVLVFEGVNEQAHTVVVVDKNGDRRLKLLITKNNVTANDRYIISSNGIVKYDRFADQNVSGRANCVIKMYSSEFIFHIRIKWRLMFYTFDLYPNGAMLVDPIKQYLQNNLQILMEGSK